MGSLFSLFSVLSLLLVRPTVFVVYDVKSLYFYICLLYAYLHFVCQALRSMKQPFNIFGIAYMKIYAFRLIAQFVFEIFEHDVCCCHDEFIACIRHFACNELKSTNGYLGYFKTVGIVVERT